MSNKFHQSVLTEYSRSYARRVCADFFSNHTFISGKQILTLTPIGQINLFIVSNLFDKWKSDAEKFRSPYFDFTHPEVEEAMRSFMNVVSQHIAVRREHLEPMLADALRKTLTLIFDPRYFFDDLLRNQPDFTLTSDAAKQIVRYTQINKFVANYLVERMNGKPFMYVNQALNCLDEVLSQRGHELEKYDRYVAILSEKVPMDLNALLRTSPGVANGSPARSFFDTELESDNTGAQSPNVGGAAEASGNQPVDLSSAPLRPTLLTETGQRTFSPAETPMSQPVVPADSFSDSPGVGVQFSPDESDRYSREPVAAPVAAPVSQASPFASGALSQSPSFEAPRLSADSEPKSNEPTSVAEAFHRAPIESIGKSISLNQKFRFINQLFSGSSTSYAQAIEELDQMENYGQALDLISYRYASQYLWDMSSDEVSELVEILKRRFS
ncbi:hypothetical protein [Rudanella lutea]|uniref:hypothetical protein n=1 Tax=Rudanella lutea TaxID=451374 RepID=UPI0003754FF5|nr:hypothetical protein [Rudanella lutea]